MSETRNITTKIEVKGESEYKSAIKTVNSELKTLQSEMKRTESQFAGHLNSYEALSAKGATLEKMYAAQKEKLSSLREALAAAEKAQKGYAENVAEGEQRVQACKEALAALGNETGDTSEQEKKLTEELSKANAELTKAKLNQEENTRKCNSYQSQINNAEAALNDLDGELQKNASYMNEAAQSSDGCAKSINEYGEEVDLAAKKEKEANEKREKTKQLLADIGKAAAAATAAVVAATVKLGKEVIDAYADYEQLVGGVETLFKDSSEKVMEYANDAYKTAGLSANEYMETVTGFSASLISSLGGDTEKAAKYANMAITDMSDNANKMGSDMESIQNAYSGFAKQNYTMLDNLKLGYGGTKEEMQRLLEDAEKLSGVKYDISSYSDIVDAIHVVQTEMGITGTTAKEAEATISGSIGMLKSSFQNLITGLGDADADVDKLCDNVVDSFNSVIKNISPVIENLAKTVPNAFEGILDAISPLLPEFLEMGAGLFEALLNGLVSMLPGLVSAVASIVPMLVESIVEALPLVVDAAVQFIAALVQGIAEALPTLIPAAVEAVATIATTLIENVSLLYDAATQLVESLITTLLDTIPQLIETGVQLLTALVTNLPEIITKVCEVLPRIIENIISTLLDNLPEIVDAGVQLLTALITNLPQIILTIVQAIPQIITGIVNAFVNNIPKLVETGIKLLTSLITDLPKIVRDIRAAMPQIINGIVDALGEGVSQVAEVGKNLVRGLWDGIQSLAGWLWDKVSGWISSIWDGITDFFGIHSPSTQMAWAGEMLVEGLAGAVDKDGKKAVQAIGGMSEEMLAEVDSGLAAVNDRLKDSIGEIETGFSAKATVEAVSASVPADLTGRGGGAAASGGGDTNVVNHFHIAELVVREEADVKKISRELYNMQKSKSRSKGVSMA